MIKVVELYTTREDTPRRTTGVTFCRQYGSQLAKLFESHRGQHGVAVRGGVEIMALAAKLACEEGCTAPSFGGTHALSNMYRHRTLPTLAEIVHPAGRNATNKYDREPPGRLYAMGDGRTAVIR